jgi:hypothetical protein
MIDSRCFLYIDLRQRAPYFCNLALVINISLDQSKSRIKNTHRSDLAVHPHTGRASEALKLT